MVIEEPNIKDNSRLNTINTARVLGINRTTLYRACKTGDIDFAIAKNGKRCYKGKDIKKFWKEHI